MFTGIIEEVGEIADMGETPAGEGFQTIRVRARRILEGIRTGASIAINGVCLTARTIHDDGFTADLSRETLDRTSLHVLAAGSLVNIERPMRADGRFDGHIVQGHVDGIGHIQSFVHAGDDFKLEIDFPETALRYIVEKGSVTVDGISLTVARVRRLVFDVAIIPHTFNNTNLKRAKAGDPVNLEFDVIAKYVERMLANRPIG